jgi:ADP-ribose pyrophosphatase
MQPKNIADPRTVFETPWFRVKERKIDSSKGSESYHFHDHPGCVLILPILDHKLLVLQREYRVAVDHLCTEISAGRIDPGETPEIAAKRELQEETGLSNSFLRALAPFYASTGSSNERCYPFVAETTLSLFEEHRTRRESGLEHLLLSWQEAVAAAINGTVEDGPSALTILRAAREYGKIQS